MLTGVRNMLSDTLRDKVAGLIVALIAAVLFLTAWILSVAAIVVFAAARLGLVGGLFAVAAGLVGLAVLIVAVMSARGRRAADRRAATRAVWAATAVTAVEAITKKGATAVADAGQEQARGWINRTSVLLTGGVALILLALFGRGKEGNGDSSPPDA